jgi:secreted trypsin-like serine protease
VYPFHKQGDSGSSLFKYNNARAYSIELTSFGGSDDHNKTNPTVVYVQVFKYIKWIEDTINLLNKNFSFSVFLFY